RSRCSTWRTSSATSSSAPTRIPTRVSPPSSPEARPLPPRPTTLPIVERFPALAAVPRVSLGRFPTPVQPLVALAPNLWIKRDDLAADPMGGNKACALEWLLAGVVAGDRIVTVGSAGSTHDSPSRPMRRGSAAARWSDGGDRK